MKALDCKETFRRLDDYVDRELSPDETAAVLQHLEHCADCSGEFRTERDLLDMLKAKLRRIKAPPGLLDRIRARLDQEGG